MRLVLSIQTILTWRVTPSISNSSAVLSFTSVKTTRAPFDWAASMTPRRIDTPMLLTSSVREKFTTRNVLEAPSRMSLALVEGPFRLLDGLWTFEPLADRGTKVRLTIRFEFKNPLTAMLLSRAFEKNCADMVDAFVLRARSV